MLSVENQLAWMPSTLGDRTPNHKPATELALSPPPTEDPDREFNFFGDDGFSFSDLLDVINPLQHIPFVSTFYREATGDTIAAAPRVMGSTLFFGPLGLAGALANVFVEESTGKDIGQHMAGWVNPAEETETAEVASVPATQGRDATLDPHDPVLSWARGEAEWARENAKTRQKPSLDTDPDKSDADTRPAPEWIPDAQPLLGDPPPPEEPVGIAQMAGFARDTRSAARAYAVTANLTAAH